jgi:hypothetical protein
VFQHIRVDVHTGSLSGRRVTSGRGEPESPTRSGDTIEVAPGGRIGEMYATLSKANSSCGDATNHVKHSPIPS